MERVIVKDVNEANIWLAKHPEVTKYNLVDFGNHMKLIYSKPTNVWGRTFYR
jgi:hypothetical protein